MWRTGTVQVVQSKYGFVLLLISWNSSIQDLHRTCLERNEMKWRFFWFITLALRYIFVGLSSWLITYLQNPNILYIAYILCILNIHSFILCIENIDSPPVAHILPLLAIPMLSSKCMQCASHSHFRSAIITLLHTHTAKGKSCAMDFRLW